MSQTKYKMPDYIRRRMIETVRGYERQKKRYEEMREDIMYGSPPPNIVGEFQWNQRRKQLDGIGMHGGRMENAISDEVPSKAEMLERLESHPIAQEIHAIDAARHNIGENIKGYVFTEKELDNLRNAVWESCLFGRNFRVEYYPVTIGRSCFYEQRRKFLWEIAKNLEVF